jgi:ribosomal protein L11 methyltransferase
MNHTLNNDIRHFLSNAIQHNPQKQPSTELIKAAVRQFAVSPRSVRKIIQDLVDAGEVAFTYEHGHSFLVRSLARPVRLSPGVVLVPPRVSYAPVGNEIAVRIAPGASFGAGDHPTTQLALQGLELILRQTDFLPLRPQSRVLDIGIGSGILSIAALIMGAGHAVGLDIDPCARHEARLNAKINDVGGKLDIRNASLDSLQGDFDLILANLRYPTLAQLYPDISSLIRPSGAVVLSGVRPPEALDLVSLYTAKNRFTCHWQAERLDWSGLVLVANNT